jgi:dihydrofolate reductase
MKDDVAVALIVAAAENGVIGRDNALPWHLPRDLQYFKRMTLGKPVIMGRRTYDEIGRPLPGRRNFVVSRQREYSPQGVTVNESLDAALESAAAQAFIDGVEEVMVIGGAQLYELALPVADRLYLTRVHAEIRGDTVFPEVDWDNWVTRSAERVNADEQNAFDLSFLCYERVRDAA